MSLFGNIFFEIHAQFFVNTNVPQSFWGPLVYNIICFSHFVYVQDKAKSVYIFCIQPQVLGYEVAKVAK